MKVVFSDTNTDSLNEKLLIQKKETEAVLNENRELKALNLGLEYEKKIAVELNDELIDQLENSIKKHTLQQNLLSDAKEEINKLKAQLEKKENLLDLANKNIADIKINFENSENKTKRLKERIHRFIRYKKSKRLFKFFK